ncbi:MAG: hypothetical protein M3Q19_16620 [Pseudomonadota bacterium]|nr:hypothetical protein [Pseudomonadota bacterium]
MRALLALPLFAMAACQVTKDDANDSVTVEYNQDVAENGFADAANLAENVGEAIANDVDDAAAKVENTDIDVDVDTGGNKAN